jgi:hypothetical protein
MYKDAPFDAVLDAYGLGDYEQRRCSSGLTILGDAQSE